MPGALGRHWRAVPRPLRFLAVGGVNTLFGYGMYAMLLFVGLHYVAAAFFGTVLAVSFNFLTTGGLVFGTLAPSRIGRFVGVYGITYLLNIACLAALTRTGLDPYLAGAICLLPMAAVSYVLMRHFVFGERPCR